MTRVMTLASDVVKNAIAEAQRTLSDKLPNAAVRMLVTGTLIAAALWLTAGFLSIAVLALALALGISTLCIAGTGTVLLLAACTAGAWASMLTWASVCAYAVLAVLTWTCSQASGLQSMQAAAPPSAAPGFAGGSRIPRAPSTSWNCDAGIGSGTEQRRTSPATRGEVCAGVTNAAVGGAGNTPGTPGAAQPPTTAAPPRSSRKSRQPFVSISLAAGQQAQGSWGQVEQPSKGTSRAESA